MAQKIKDSKIHTTIDTGLLKRLGGKSFCQTGTMSLTRQQLNFIIQALGGTGHSAINSTTSYLIIPNGNEFTKGSKYRAALNAGTTIITEKEFCTMILPTIDELRGNDDGDSY